MQCSLSFIRLHSKVHSNSEAMPTDDTDHIKVVELVTYNLAYSYRPVIIIMHRQLNAIYSTYIATFLSASLKFTEA